MCGQAMCVYVHVCNVCMYVMHVCMYVMYEFMSMYSHACVPMSAYALICMCVCIVCAHLYYFFLFFFLNKLYYKYICSYLQMQKSLAGVGMYVHRNLYVSAFMCVCVCMHMFVSMCMSLDACVSWITP